MPFVLLIFSSSFVGIFSLFLNFFRGHRFRFYRRLFFSCNTFMARDEHYFSNQTQFYVSIYRFRCNFQAKNDIEIVNVNHRKNNWTEWDSWESIIMVTISSSKPINFQCSGAVAFFDFLYLHFSSASWKFIYRFHEEICVFFSPTLF